MSIDKTAMIEAVGRLVGNLVPTGEQDCDTWEAWAERQPALVLEQALQDIKTLQDSLIEALATRGVTLAEFGPMLALTAPSGLPEPVEDAVHKSITKYVALRHARKHLTIAAKAAAEALLEVQP